MSPAAVWAAPLDCIGGILGAAARLHDRLAQSLEETRPTPQAQQNGRRVTSMADLVGILQGGGGR